MFSFECFFYLHNNKQLLKTKTNFNCQFYQIWTYSIYLYCVSSTEQCGTLLGEDYRAPSDSTYERQLKSRYFPWSVAARGVTNQWTDLQTFFAHTHSLLKHWQLSGYLIFARLFQHFWRYKITERIIYITLRNFVYSKQFFFTKNYRPVRLRTGCSLFNITKVVFNIARLPCLILQRFINKYHFSPNKICNLLKRKC